jgi:mRNA interferase MazF
MPISPSRGDIWVVRLDPVEGHEQGGKRPALIVSDDRFNQLRAGLVILLPITGTDRGFRTHVKLEPPEGGLRKLSFIKCEDVRSVSQTRLIECWGQVRPSTLREVEDRLRVLMRL